MLTLLRHLLLLLLFDLLSCARVAIEISRAYLRQMRAHRQVFGHNFVNSRERGLVGHKRRYIDRGVGRTTNSVADDPRIF